MTLRWCLALLILAGCIAAAVSSVTTVQPGEVVVVRRFGRALTPPWGPGLHLALPFGLDRRDRVRIDEVRRVEVGIGDEAPGPELAPGEGEFLTADGNFLRARAVVQYRVADPTAFVIASDDLDRLLARAVESSVSRALSHQLIDTLLRSGRAEAASTIAADLADIIKRQQLGLEVLGVSLTDTRPPVEVLPDFADAQAAASERDRRTQDAQTDAAVTRSRANALAQVARESAHAQADRGVALAKAKAARFLALLAEYERSKALTAQRLYADAIRELLPRPRRKVLAEGEMVDLSLLGESP